MAKVLFTEEVEFHDTATITVSANRETMNEPPHFEEVTIVISTAVSIDLTLTVGQAANLSSALAAAVLACEGRAKT